MALFHAGPSPSRKWKSPIIRFPTALKTSVEDFLKKDNIGQAQVGGAVVVQ